MLIVKEWRIVKNWNPFTVPELQNFYLQGKVYGSEIFEDGDLIITPSIKNVRDCRDYKVIVTKNCEYAIYKNDVDKEYEDKYNNTFEGLSFKK